MEKSSSKKAIPRSFNIVTSNPQDPNVPELFQTPTKNRKYSYATNVSAAEIRYRRISKNRMTSIGSSISEEVNYGTSNSTTSMPPPYQRQVSVGSMIGSQLGAPSQGGATVSGSKSNSESQQVQQQGQQQPDTDSKFLVRTFNVIRLHQYDLKMAAK